MKTRVVVTDLRDDKEYEVIVESWETLATVGSLLQSKIPDAPPQKQHFYVSDDELSLTLPADQLRKKARAAGLLKEEDDEGEIKTARVFLYVGPTSLDFSDMMMDDITKKLRRHVAGEMKQVLFRITLSGVETKLNLSVDSAAITVDEFKRKVIKQMGPPSLTGLREDNLLLYERGVQQGKPLEGDDIQKLFGPRWKIDIDGYTAHAPVTLRLIVKKWHGLAKVEEHELTVLDHEQVEDLKVKICDILQQSPNPLVSKKKYLPYTLEFTLAGISLSKKGCQKLYKKYGIPAAYLWLRVFNIKDQSPCVVCI